ncbi:hypothetical protein CDO52_19715 [Nocardiopsis gilva YIM 90087]|uniref:UPF0225 protein CDO52_19715 n=1 Tax=Nocardiopsis gilva YIM 90087 TaxID=1235441 RepID=A0A223S9E7_9ACTN|nr:YchJ family protein [Nocardiopsis gilva]ASU84731.1 hypothetical protein CDO52_19715 [Nocardiopsis gilva YIM 90087]
MSKNRSRDHLHRVDLPCPCGLAKVYGDCCGPLHRGERSASTAEQLMRSRYSAFAVGHAGYLVQTWHPRTRPRRVGLEAGIRWLRLDVLGTTGGSPFHVEGTVSFRAIYSDNGDEGELRENSRFVRHEGAWTYLDALG